MVKSAASGSAPGRDWDSIWRGRRSKNTLLRRTVIRRRVPRRHDTDQIIMSTYWQSFRGGIAERWRRLLGVVLMSLNDPQWGRGGGKNSGPPDLDELMRNFNQKMGSLFGRKGGGEGRTPGGPRFAQFGGGAGILVALVVIVWLLSGFYIVDASQRGMVLRFGKFVEETLPGPHWHLPFPIETAEIVNLSQVRTIEIGSRNGGQSQVAKDTLDLTAEPDIHGIHIAGPYVGKEPADVL